MRASFRPSAVFALVLCLAAPAFAQAVPFFNVKPGTILEKFGLTMSEQEARERIAFHPFVPSTSYTEVALIPPFHGDDKDHPENRGIGYEYPENGIFYVLREWPRAGGSLEALYASGAYHGPKDCPNGFFTMGTPRFPRAVAWETQALVFALQPDIPYGENPNLRALRAEWERLAKRGVCR
jgi:hypothetical protein